MTSATWMSTPPPAPHPGPGSRDTRRRRHRVAVAAVVLAFAVTGAALLSSVGSLTWGAPATATISEPPTATPVVSRDADGTTTDQEGANDDHRSDQDADAHQPAAGDPAAGGAYPGEPGTDGSAEERAREDGDADAGRGDDEPVDDEPSGDDDGVADGSTTEGSAVDGSTEHGGPDADDPQDDEPQLDVTQVQEKLRAYRFLIGPADGSSGQQTTAAVMAFQRVNGLAVDGVVGPATSAALRDGSAEPTLAGGPAERIEVDLDAQLLHLVEGGERTVTLQVSSGSGEPYTTASGGTARGVTPVGDFVVERRIHGVRTAPLGTLYDPLYFHRGFAIHGSPSVPASPASHGCIRVAKADAAWLIERIPDGMPVQLSGGTHVFTP